MDEQIRPINSSVEPTGALKPRVPATRADLLLGDIQNPKVLSGGFVEKARVPQPAEDNGAVKRGYPSYNGDTARNDTPAPSDAPKPGLFR